MVYKLCSYTLYGSIVFYLLNMSFMIHLLLWCHCHYNEMRVRWLLLAFVLALSLSLSSEVLLTSTNPANLNALGSNSLATAAAIGVLAFAITALVMMIITVSYTTEKALEKEALAAEAAASAMQAGAAMNAAAGGAGAPPAAAAAAAAGRSLKIEETQIASRSKREAAVPGLNSSYFSVVSRIMNLAKGLDQHLCLPRLLCETQADQKFVLTEQQRHFLKLLGDPSESFNSGVKGKLELDTDHYAKAYQFGTISGSPNACSKRYSKCPYNAEQLIGMWNTAIGLQSPFDVPSVSFLAH